MDMEQRELERRVRQSEDGAYCWTYFMDMWHDPYMFGMVMKIFFWIALGMGLVAMMMGDWGRTPGWVVGLIFFGGFLVLWPIIYVIWALCAHGVMRMFFVMTDDYVLQTAYTQKTRNVTDALEILTLVAGLATGHAGQAARTTTNVHNASREQPNYFSGVKGIVEQRDRNMIVLKNMITRARIPVPPEDYDFVLEHIRAHVPEWVLDEKEVEARSRGRKARLWIAAAVSLIANLITVPINVSAYKATGMMKLSWNGRGGDYGVQRAFALLGEDWYSAEAPFQHRLSFSPVYAVIGFLAVALVVWLVLTIVAAIRRKVEK